ncbi:hypothetical protein FC778_13500 [Clostridium botulinum]|nr:hypothetical protein [Clostridium botulinum]
MSEVLKEQFKALGYKEIKETKTYIELKTKQYGIYERIKIFKNTLEVIRDNHTGAGNRGFSRLSFKEIKLISQYLNLLKED